MSLKVQPVSFDAACQFVATYHRHHRPPRGHKFSIGAFADNWLVGVAIVGRPVARALADGRTAEVTRLATDGTRNACSALYAAAARRARQQLGAARVITYTRADESGASLRGAGWTEVARLRARRGWDTPSRHRRGHGTDGVARIRWEAPAPRTHHHP